MGADPMTTDRISPAPTRERLIIIGVIAAAITVCEIILAWPVFASPYNWFHLK
jgi:hypothetical protein